jgi:hypothetical protein
VGIVPEQGRVNTNDKTISNTSQITKEITPKYSRTLQRDGTRYRGPEGGSESGSGCAVAITGPEASEPR